MAAWAEERKGRGAQRANVSFIPQPPRRGQPPPHQHAWARAATAWQASTRPGASAGGCIAEQRGRATGDGSPSRAVLAPCKRSPSRNVARNRSEANAVRSEQATCAVTNHIRRAAGIQPLQRCEAVRSAQCATAIRIRRALQCAVRRAAQCARGAAAGASALADVKGAAVEFQQWCALLRPAAQRAEHHRDARMPRSSACGATSGAARARRRSFANASRWLGWAPVGCGAGLHLLCACIRPTLTRGRSLTASGGARGGCRACQAKTRLPCRRSIFAFALPALTRRAGFQGNPVPTALGLCIA
jgi:hypothetical protein